MQGANQNFLEFARRTDALATHLHKNLIEMPAVIGVSSATFFANRKGKQPISGKTWSKLEQAERFSAHQQQQQSSSRIMEEHATPTAISRVLYTEGSKGGHRAKELREHAESLEKTAAFLRLLARELDKLGQKFSL